MTVTLNRRRAITLLAVATGLPLYLLANRTQTRLMRWEGYTLGAPSTIQLYHEDENQARAAIAAGLAELARMEALFSLYRTDSVLSTLNREGSVNDAPPEFIDLVTHSLRLAELSGGAYDPTIQPVWDLYFRHFTTGRADPAGPAPEALKQALALVGWRGLEVDAAAARVAFTRPGMGLTLNSGAQGYVTDRVAAVLSRHGFKHMLVDMGEPRALSTKPDGTAWRIGLANPADPTRALVEVDVVDKAVSTSGGYGTLFDPDGNFTHIIDPFTGRTAPRLLGVSVVAETAKIADGLSTALLLVPAERRQELLRAAGGLTVYYVTPDGLSARVDA